MNYKEKFAKSYSTGLFKMKEVQEILDVSRSTLVRWAKDNRLVPIKIGASTRYKVADIERVINNGL